MISINSILDDSLDVQLLRQVLKNARVRKKLYSIGVDIQVYELHAPAETAIKRVGLGVTLCGRKRSMRHAEVTCTVCLKKLEAKIEKPFTSERSRLTYQAEYLQTKKRKRW